MKFPDFKDKKVLIMGLGLLGRGIGDAKFFAEAGAKVTVTDLKSRGELTPSLKELTRLREALVDYFFGDNQYQSTDQLWQKYFYAFNYAARINY